MSRGPAFWIGAVVIALVAALFAARYFPRAFPLVALDITMDRPAALEAARRLAAAHRLGPPGFRQAASFRGDSEAQTFIELEGGGKDAFARMLRLGLYAAYQWHVRHFKPGETNETLIQFTPDGRPYGFREKLREDAPGAALPAEAARAIAEHGAAAWGVDLSVFEQVEASREIRPGGRVDHTFVYERRDERLNDGRYRLRLVVSGDRLTEVTRFVQVPEAFSRRYAAMRSANLAINLAANAAMVVLYLVGGVGVGLFVLLRQRWVIWRPAVRWGVFVALLQMLVTVNAWPLRWMEYDTAMSVEQFVLQQMLFALVGFVGLALLLSVSFMAAESLTRRAFPHHPQLWRLWDRAVAATPAVLGRTVGGYLLVALFFAYEVALYFVSTRLLGWWTPSDLLFHPDVLATYVPWLTAIAASLQAGFWEEALFRAVPLAGAALLAERFGRRPLWLGGALLVQAVVFGAGHAAYATQPPYARLVELILPSLVFGWLYLRFGLLPSIVLHFTFDVIWFALPLFVARTPGVWLDQAMVVLVTLTPLWIVLGQRWRAGRWHALEGQALNGAWQPPPVAAPSFDLAAVRPAALSAGGRRAVLAAGAVGLVVFVGAAVAGSTMRVPVPPFRTTRAQAAEAARRVLRERGVGLDARWRVLPRVAAAPDQAHRFVWETAGRERYLALLGAYLAPPRWVVRVATFEGDVAARAEEWAVTVSGDGAVGRIRHTLPEARPGPSLDEPAARRLAEQHLRQRLGVEPARLKPISAEPAKRPQRTDWTFTYADTTLPPLPQGEPRLRVVVAGDEVVDSERFVFVPEAWERADRNRRVVVELLQVIGAVTVVGTLLAATIAAVVAWSRRRFVVPVGLSVAAVVLVVNVGQAANGWPTRVAGFSTAQPLPLQVLMVLLGVAVSSLVVSAAAGLGAGVAPTWTRSGALTRRMATELAMAAGAALAAVQALAELLRARQAPVWPSFTGAATAVPALAPALEALGRYMLLTVVVTVAVAWADRVTRGWTRRRGVAAGLLLVFGMVAGGTGAADTLREWVIAGGLAGLMLVLGTVFVGRYDLATVPIATGTMIILSVASRGLAPVYPGALVGSALGLAGVGAVASWWAALLRRHRGDRVGA
jgi:hypothetical protein